jgi:hypothetical protein
MTAMNRKPFDFTTTIHQEMDRFRRKMMEDPGRGKELFAKGSELVSLASRGHFHKFCTGCQEVLDNHDIPLIYFVSKSLEVSLQSQHLMISAFIFDNGYPLHGDLTLPNVLLSVLKSDASDDQCSVVIDFLSTKKFNFNSQEPKTWWSPLHYAVERGLDRSVECLINHGADVNVVADKDVMPLNLAITLSGNSSNHEVIRRLLVVKGAKETWRKGVEQTGRVGFAITESTSVAVSHSTSVAPKRTLMSFRGGFDAPLILTPIEPASNTIAMTATTPTSTETAQPDVVNDTDTVVVVGESDDGNAFLFSTG